MPGPRAEALGDARGILDRAIEARVGVQVDFASTKALRLFRQRLYSARKRDREQSRRMYEPGHAMRGKSPYDVLIFIEHLERQCDTCGRATINRLLVRRAEGTPYGVLDIKEIEGGNT